MALPPKVGLPPPLPRPPGAGFVVRFGFSFGLLVFLVLVRGHLFR